MVSLLAFILLFPFPSLPLSLSYFFLYNVMTKDKHGGNKGTIGKHTDTLEGKIGAVVGVFVDFPFGILQMVDFLKKKKKLAAVVCEFLSGHRNTPPFPSKDFFCILN